MTRVSESFARMIPRRFRLRRQKAVVAVEFAGEWLKLAHVSTSAKGKRLVGLVARKVASPDELSKTLLELVKAGMIPTDSVLVSIPRNLVTVRTLQLPTTDLHELREMISLQAAKQTPYSKDEIIPAFQVLRTSPEGHTDAVLVTTHRSVSNAWLKALDEAHLKADGIRLSSQGVLSRSRRLRGSTTDELSGPLAVLDIDSNFSDFIVSLNGAMSFTRVVPIGAAKLLEGREKEIERFAEEILRAIDLYESEGIGRRITKLVVTGAEGADTGLAGLIPALTEKVRRPVERLFLPEDVLGSQGLPEGERGSLSFAAVLGLAWDAEPAKIDLTPPEVRLKEALAQKGRAVVVTGVLAVAILTALTALISQHLYSKRQYLEQLNQEILRTQDAAGEVEVLRKKIKIIRDVARPQNSSLEILYVLHKSTPSDVYLKSVTFDEGSQVVLKGVSQKMSTVFEFVSILEKLPTFRHVKTKHVAKSGTREGGEETEFEIICPLRKNSET